MTAAAHIPLDKVFVKQRLDIMTAQAWLYEDLNIQDNVVKLSGAPRPQCLLGQPRAHCGRARAGQARKGWACSHTS